MSKAILLINPALSSRVLPHPANYLDAVIAAERGRIDKEIFEQFIWPRYQAMGVQATYHHYPEQTASLGLLSLAAVLRDAGHRVEYAQADHDPESLQRLVERAGAFDLVGATAMCTTIEQSLTVLAGIKERHGSRVTTVLGGPQVTPLPWDDVGDTRGVDILVRGEGEQVMLAIAGNGAAPHLEEVPGIDYRRDGRIHSNDGSNQLSLEYLRAMPPPAYDLVPDLANTQLYLQFSRGCQFRCHFCSEHGTLRYLSRRQIEDVLGALERVRQRNLIFVVDSTFITPAGQGFLDDFEQAVGASGCTNHFAVQTRIRGLDAAVLRRLHHARVANYFFGVENTSDVVLRAANKGARWQHVVEGFTVARQFFVDELGYTIPPYRANFIQGLPGEDEHQRVLNLRRRYYLLERGLVLNVNDSIFQPTPGSRFYTHSATYGIELPPSYRTAARGALPQHGNRDAAMSQLAVFLHHLQMRQVANETLIRRFGLDSIRRDSDTMLRSGDTPKSVKEYVRC